MGDNPETELKRDALRKPSAVSNMINPTPEPHDPYSDETERRIELYADDLAAGKYPNIHDPTGPIHPYLLNLLTPEQSSLVQAEHALLHPKLFYSPADINNKSIEPPRHPGVYAWYFDKDCLPGLPERSYEREGRLLLYVGICPSKPVDPPRLTRRTLRNRMREHCVGPAAVSTLRRSLGALLSEKLSLNRHPTGRADKWTFGFDGEQRLSRWMEEHARVVWAIHPSPWLVEQHLIAWRPPALNLKGVIGPFRDHLSGRRTVGGLRSLGGI